MIRQVLHCMEKLGIFSSAQEEITFPTEVNAPSAMLTASSSSSYVTGSSSLHTGGTSFELSELSEASPPRQFPDPTLDDRPTRPANQFFTPFRSLGIEVGPLDGVMGHMFYAELKTNRCMTLPPLLDEDGHVVPSEENAGAKCENTAHPDNICVDFVRVPLVGERLKVHKSLRLGPERPLPLYLTSVKQPKISKSGYVFSRFPGKLRLEHSGVAASEEYRGAGDKFAQVERDSFFKSPPFICQKLIEVEICGINDEDLLIIKSVDAKMVSDYRQLGYQLKAYYDTAVTNTVRERIPQDRIVKRMIVVALVFPGTTHARFIRAQVLEIRRVKFAGKHNTLVTIHGVDDDSTYFVPVQNVCYIDEDFMRLPFMVQACRLIGLEFFHGTGIFRKHFLKSVNTKTKFRADFADYHDENGCVGIRLFTGCDENEQPVNYMFLQELIGYLAPSISLDEEKTVDLCHCDDKGSAWFHVKNEVLPKLLSFSSVIEEKIPKLQSSTVDSLGDDVLAGHLHVARSSADGTFYRARVVEIFYDTNQALVQFVDWGNWETVSVPFIYRADDIDPGFAKIPAQAFQTHIDCFQSINPKKALEIFDGIPICIRVDQGMNERERKIKRCTGFVQQHGNDKVPLESFVKLICDEVSSN